MEKPLSCISKELLAHNQAFMGSNDTAAFPGVENIIVILTNLRSALFPFHFCDLPASESAVSWHESLLKNTFLALAKEIKIALSSKTHNKDRSSQLANNISRDLFECLLVIQQLLYKDAKASFEGDPAAKSVDEVILTYPGFFAVFIYRIAHFLYTKDIPFIPRIMSEYAHSVTGIDIHPGAKIGEYFFIDHGTGVVVGETAVIGNNVKLYQGVTLGALSTKRGQKLAGVRRHPTIEDNVTVYSGATILGGGTVIAKGSTIGGNMFITESIPPKTHNI